MHPSSSYRIQEQENTHTQYSTNEETLSYQLKPISSTNTTYVSLSKDTPDFLLTALKSIVYSPLEETILTS